jgi:hypothetical protein
MPHASLVRRPSSASPDPPATGADSSSPSFLRLVRIYVQNEALLKELSRSQQGIEQALTYLGQPGANTRLGRARLAQLRRKRSGLLCLLRSNRIALGSLGLIP